MKNLAPVMIRVLYLMATFFCCHKTYSQHYDGSLPITLSENKKWLEVENEEGDLKRITKVYDTIIDQYRYYIAHKANKVDVYTTDSANLIVKNADAVYPVKKYYSTLQIFSNHKIWWLTPKTNKLLSAESVINPMSVCGTVNRYKCYIQEYSDSIYYKFQAKDPNDQIIDSASFIINLSRFGIQGDVFLLNNTKDYFFDGNSFSDYKINHLFLLIKNKKQISIAKLTHNKSDTKCETILSDIDKIFIPYNTPIMPFIFKKNGLLGYFPFNKKARYIFLNPLEYNFTRFCLPNGKKGWLDVSGREYLD